MHRKYQSGFSMIEIFISLVVMSVGILGLGGLQMNAAKAVNNSYSENIASMLISELSERMRSKKIGVSGGFYGTSSINCEKTETQCRSGTSCTAEQTARFDLHEIMCGTVIGDSTQGGISNLLPQGSLSIECDTPEGSIATRSSVQTTSCSDDEATHNITISWNTSSSHKSLDDITSSLTVGIIP